MLAFSPAVAARLRETNTAIVITGAGGWIGQATLEMLEATLGPSMADRVHAYGSSDRQLMLRSGSRLQIHALRRLQELSVGEYHLVHLAFRTREHVGEHSIDDYAALNASISSSVLQHAQQRHVLGLFLPSSGAVYGDDGLLEESIERNPYGALKRTDEESFSTVAHPDRSAVVRLFNLSGPFLNKPEAYVLGSILNDISAGGPIRLMADHPVLRSYVHVRDLVDIAFAIMTGIVDSPRTPFDTAGVEVIEVGELAQLALALLGREGMKIERLAFDPAATADRYVGDGTTIRALAAAAGIPLASLQVQVLETADYLRSLQPERVTTLSTALHPAPKVPPEDGAP